MDWYILMILTYTTDIGKMSELTLGQGHKFKGEGQICAYLKNGKKYLKSTDWHMLMILTYTTNIGKMSELTLGQGYKVKDQGQIFTDIKKLEKLTKNQWIGRCWCYLYILLTLFKCLSWPKVKVRR